MFSYAGITTIYLSSKGSDYHLGIHYENDKMLNGPVQSFAKAIAIVSEMRRSNYRQPVTIALMDEEYDLTSPLDFSYPGGEPENLPAVFRDVTFMPFKRDRVLLSGGKRITGFAPDTFNGAACLSVKLPEVEEGKWKFSDLYVNGKPANKTRAPETGYFYPEAVEQENDGLRFPSRWFIAAKGDIPEGARNVEDALINFCHYWVDEHGGIKSYDPETRRVDFDGVTRFTVSAKKGRSSTMAYYIENLGEYFKNPGEWYLDRPTGMLYYIPKDGETAENIVVYAPVIDRLVNIHGRPEEGKLLDGIAFHHIDFAYTKGDSCFMTTRKMPDGTEVPEKIMSCGQGVYELHGAVNISYATGCELKDCRIYSVGTHGIVMRHGASGCRFIESSVRYAAGGGVLIGGSGDIHENPLEFAHDNVVSDCLLEELGLRYFGGCGVLIGHAYNCEVSHNTIRHLYYSGISVGWRWGYSSVVCRNNIVRKNHIYDLGRSLLSDMGGIYILGGQPGLRVEGNLIHNIKSRDYGGWALYTDEGSAYITFSDNICYDCSSNCYHQHYGYMNVVRNNIFFDAKEGLVRVSRREAQEELLLSNNILIANGEQDIYTGMMPGNFTTDNNVIYSTAGKATFFRIGEEKADFSRARKDLGFDENSVEANPRVKNLAAHDFTLRADSPALKLGFRPIDMSDVGPRGTYKEN